MRMVHLRAVMLLLAVPALAGCVAAPTKPMAGSYARLMQQADARYQAQDLDGAKLVYAQAAAADPAQQAPWYRLAKIDFDQQNYGHAIVDAQEALRRDPVDAKAESLLTIAGLRVAVDALGRLHEESDQQGPAHLEAEKLAAKMRATLGQDVLVPPKPRRARRHHRRHQHQHQQAVTPRPAPTSTPAESAANTSNPFQALPGGSGR